MENKEFIRVYCRVRPTNEKEKQSKNVLDKTIILLDDQQCIICQTPYIQYTADSSSNHNFVFDSVFDESSDQVFF